MSNNAPIARPLTDADLLQIKLLDQQKEFMASPRELTLDDMLGLNQPSEEDAFQTFKYFKNRGAFKSNKGLGEMVADGFNMIGDSLSEMAKTWPDRFASNFVEFD